ncbi:putative methyltransferase [Oscillibacter valericigenes Sjm18-20]|nr:putative methyltransferase [Oscillibacter valericigenes Sjm18-20]
MEYFYTISKKKITRNIQFKLRRYSSDITSSEISGDTFFTGEEDYEQRWLQCKEKPISRETNGNIRVVDLFCGCGGLSLGISEACRALEYKFEAVLAADLDETALNVYKKNFSPQFALDKPIETYIDSNIGDPLSDYERNFISMVGNVDVLIGGPPCQGNSDLNNHTRRSDPRNLLYLRMIRCAEIVKPKYILIENVPGVQHDKHGVVDIAKSTLEDMGYRLDSGIIDMSAIGVPQKRKRFFLIASKTEDVSLSNAITWHTAPSRTLGWAIGDLIDYCNNKVFDTPANSSLRNKERIDYLFENDLFDLPNSERPDCHRLKKHSYTSVYGRMHWDIPSPTITGGFGSNGQGRFVHPYKRRTITPHEAARLQFFPDYFNFDGVKRRELQQIIGNAVPSKASYIIGIEFLAPKED